MSNTTYTAQQQAQAAIQVIRAIADTIKAAGRIPSGTLYAALMAQGCTLSQYDQVINILVNAGLIRQEHHLLIWIAN